MAWEDIPQWLEDVSRLENVQWSGTLESTDVHNEVNVLLGLRDMDTPPGTPGTPGTYTRSEGTLEGDEQSILKQDLAEVDDAEIVDSLGEMSEAILFLARGGLPDAFEMIDEDARESRIFGE